MIWSIDFKESIKRFFLKYLVKGDWLQYIGVFGNEMNRINGWFTDKVDEVVYNLNHSASIISLEKILNEYYSLAYTVATRDAKILAGDIIWIESRNLNKLYIYKKSELETPLYLRLKSESLPAPYLITKNEFLATNTFIINVPVSLSFTDIDIKRLVDKYNLATKRYNIITY